MRIKVKRAVRTQLRTAMTRRATSQGRDVTARRDRSLVRRRPSVPVVARDAPRDDVTLFPVTRSQGALAWLRYLSLSRDTGRDHPLQIIITGKRHELASLRHERLVRLDNSYASVREYAEQQFDVPERRSK